MAVDASALVAAVRDYAEGVAQDLADAFADEVRANAPRRTGELVDSVEVGGVVGAGTSLQVSIVVLAEHARYQEEGTGIYGPEGQPITARAGGVLVFDWAAAGGLVFARSVAGTEPTHFFQRALDRFPELVRQV